MIKRTGNRIIKNETVEDYHTIITDVQADGKQFIECYVGVRPGDRMYSIYKSIDHHDKRFNFISKKAFEDFGAKKEYSSRREFFDLLPLDGAWLSFAKSGETYDFLDNLKFYYGAGFLVGANRNCTVENNIDAAETLIKRLIDALQKGESVNEFITIETTPENVHNLLKRTKYWNQYIYSYTGKDTPISKVLIDENVKIVLYDFDKEVNQKIYQVLGTTMQIRADGLIVREFYYKDKIAQQEICHLFYSSAVIDGLSRNGLHQADILKISELINTRRYSNYWMMVIFNLGRRINRRDRNNIWHLLKNVFKI